MLAIPACLLQQGEPPLVTPDSMIVWDRPSLDEGIGWKLCIDEHPCVDLGPISARSSNGISQTYQSPFWSDRVASYLSPGTHRLAVVVYKVDDRTRVSQKSAAVTVRVGPQSSVLRMPLGTPRL